jgi:ADP-dependent NAD(P)H-hydrate dehydratase / NAD(P)H-hydrate epimerase
MRSDAVIRALTAEQARAVEQRAIAEQGVELGALMRAAGAAVAAEVAGRVPDGIVYILAGPGNNGGDGWVAARDLHADGHPVRVLTTRDPRELTGIAADAAKGAIVAGVHWRAPEGPLTAADLADASVIVDALLGIGGSGALREPLDSWARVVNESSAYVVAVDAPTGIDGDSGSVPGDAVHADCTLTFTAPKRGLVLFPAAGHAGEIVVADVGVDGRFVTEVLDAPEIWTAEQYAALLPLPAADIHKNARGRVLVIAGSGTFPGAAVLATRGAMRVGAGYVTLAVPEGIVTVAQGHLLAAPVVGMPQGRTHAFSSAAADKALALARDFDAVVLGPGLTMADGAAATVRALVSKLDIPLVIDADALNALVDAHELVERRKAPTVITPHPGELARLLGVSAADVQADRVSSSAKLAGPGRVVVLKGAGTVTSGDGRQVINTSGTPALATAGTGDVLAGVIGGLLAQGLSAFDAAVLGAYWHGRAGEAAAADLTPLCVTSEDVPEYLPVAAAELLGSW